ncbi:MAG: hypothetical protein HQL21_00920 [Candidatus Omnitrophica bacterium]|nr:hypothetical protein [Candidatus Omnitrophota bacterium]
MYFLLISVPVALAGLCFALKIAAGPYWHYYDSCYSYLINGLNIASGKQTFFFYHPGTPVQLLCSSVMRVLNIGRSSSEMINRVLADPELYLSAVHAVLVALFLVSSLLLVIDVYRKTRDFLAAFVMQLPGLIALGISVLSIPAGANVAPELLLMSIINLYILSLFQLFSSGSPYQEWRAALWLGFLCGLGISTKYSFFPLALVPLLVLHWREKILFLIVALGAFLLWTMPLWYAYSNLWGAIQLNLCNVSGGTPRVGFFNFSSFISVLGQVARDFWFFVLVSCGALILSFIKPVMDKSNRYLFLLRASALGVLFQFFVLGRHYMPYYAIPGVCLSGLVLLMIFLIYKPQSFRFMGVLLLGVYICCTAYAVFVCVEQARMIRQGDTFVKELRSQYPGYYIISSYIMPAPIEAHALSYGVDTAGNQVVDALSRQYPFMTTYDPGAHMIWNHTSRWLADDLMNKFPGILIVGGQLDLVTNSPHQVRLVKHQGDLYAYLLIASTEKQANILFVNAKAFLSQGKYVEAAIFASKSLEFGFNARAEAEAILKEAKDQLSR